MTRTRFGILPDGSVIEELRMETAAGLELRAISYGCIITALNIPDARGRRDNVVLGFDGLAPYLHSSPYFGAVVGRYANRIASGRFTIDGREHQVSVNEPPNHLHGGFRGFDKQVWTVEPAGDSALVFRRRSADGEEGYPGVLDVEVRYEFSGPHELQIKYDAACDAPTHVNLTQHSYFNLRGTGDALGHFLTIDADAYLPVRDDLIPAGGPQPVDGTPFDFRAPTRIGERGHPYDHNYVLNGVGSPSSPARMAAKAFDPESGRTLELSTSEPGLQFYSGQVVGFRGFCLEPQHFPDSPNRPDFPPTLLRPGGRYRSTSRYRFTF